MPLAAPPWVPGSRRPSGRAPASSWSNGSTGPTRWPWATVQPRSSGTRAQRGTECNWLPRPTYNRNMIRLGVIIIIPVFFFFLFVSCRRPHCVLNERVLHERLKWHFMATLLTALNNFFTHGRFCVFWWKTVQNLLMKLLIWYVFRVWTDTWLIRDTWCRVGVNSKISTPILTLVWELQLRQMSAW